MTAELTAEFKTGSAVKKRLILASFNKLAAELPTLSLFLKKIKLMYHRILQKIKKYIDIKAKKSAVKSKVGGQI